MGHQIYFKIAGYVDPAVLIIFTLVRFLVLLTVFELLPKTCNFTICSIFSNSGHVGWCTASPYTILRLDSLVMIRRRFLKKFTTDDDDGCQVMAIAHMILRVR